MKAMMQNHQLLVAFILGLLGAVAIGYILRALLSPLLGSLSNISKLPEQARLKRKESILTSIDEDIEKGSQGEALKRIETAFMWEQASSITLAEKVHAHNLSVLSRLVALAETHGQHISNLAVLEDLIGTRLSLCRNYLDVEAASKKAKKRGKQDKREVPAWALLEFSRKLSELNEKLKINRRTLESQVQTALSSLGKEQQSTSVTYH
jgi:hypothetical protein